MRDTIYRYNTPLRIALLADLHDRELGWITDSLKARKPDIICIAGDVVHRVDLNTDGLATHQTKFVLPFLKACAEIAPTFLSLGNHEWTLCNEDIAVMAETGVTVLDNRFVRYKNVAIGGLSSAGVTAYREYRKDKSERYPEWDYGDRPDAIAPDVSWLDDFCKHDGYKILLCHHPEYRNRYLKDMPIEAVLCGHAHGGQIRLFGQGLFAPGQGILPKYTSGVNGNMIISKGLANTAGTIPRLFNPREVVYIEPI
ncbi:metallophosphoesterase [Ruminococcus sp.]|uniref:metallophosphoesterase n=1 Tax=Ruminococcus sp. TaxID=41978 RepID=UPI0025D4369B|nr:metallophosphoesterase [Ruminococcus sp.]MBQ9542759.1 metallophosphoesterase [Ruminococcus sp.]